MYVCVWCVVCDEVAAEPLGAFKDRYIDAYQCVQMDEAPPACWLLFDIHVLPRFANLREGKHTMRAAV